MARLFSLGTFIKKNTKINEIKLKAEIAKNGICHIIAASAAPTMGLKTFPNVFEVSIIPKQELAFSSSSL